MKEPTPSGYKRLRKSIGLTQTETAAALGVYRETIALRETKGPVSREAWMALKFLKYERDSQSK